MRRYAIVLGLAASLAAATAAPAAAQTVTPSVYDYGTIDPKQGAPLAEFQLTAGAAPLNGVPTVVSGDSVQFGVLAGFCGGSLAAEQSCIFRVRVNPKQPGAASAEVGVAGGPTATVRAVIDGPTGTPSKGKGKKCGKKKGKKSAAAAKKKKSCKKKKGKKR